MKKKVVAMFLAAVMALSLVACGSKSDNGGSGDASGTETIKLGGVGPLTGGYANYGLSVQHGAELAAKEINAAGGVNGKQLELSFQDSQGDPESAVAAYGKLMDWGMNVCLGGVLSGGPRLLPWRRLLIQLPFKRWNACHYDAPEPD